MSKQKIDFHERVFTPDIIPPSSHKHPFPQARLPLNGVVLWKEGRIFTPGDCGHFLPRPMHSLLISERLFSPPPGPLLRLLRLELETLAAFCHVKFYSTVFGTRFSDVFFF